MVQQSAPDRRAGIDRGPNAVTGGKSMQQRSDLNKAIREHMPLIIGFIAGILDTAVIVLAFALWVTM